MAGSAAPEQTGAEADIVFGVLGSSESTMAPTTKTVHEVDAAESTEEPLTVGVSEIIPNEKNVRTPAEPPPKPLVVKGLPAGGNVATGKCGRLVALPFWSPCAVPRVVS